MRQRLQLVSCRRAGAPWRHIVVLPRFPRFSKYDSVRLLSLLTVYENSSMKHPIKQRPGCADRPGEAACGVNTSPRSRHGALHAEACLEQAACRRASGCVQERLSNHPIRGRPGGPVTCLLRSPTSIVGDARQEPIEQSAGCWSGLVEKSRRRPSFRGLRGALHNSLETLIESRPR